MEIVHASQTRALLNWTIVAEVLFRSEPLTNTRKNNQGYLTKDRACLLWKHAGRCGGWPPVKAALEEIPAWVVVVVGASLEWVILKVPFNPEIPRTLRGLGQHSKLGMFSSESRDSLNFRNSFVE